MTTDEFTEHLQHSEYLAYLKNDIFQLLFRCLETTAPNLDSQMGLLSYDLS